MSGGTRSRADVAEPERLAHHPRLGPLLEQTNARFGAGLDEGAAFRKLLQRVARQQPRTVGRQFLGWGFMRWQPEGRVLLLALLAGGGLTVAAALSVTLLREAPRIVVGPERRSIELKASPVSTPKAAELLETSGRTPPAPGPSQTEVASHALELERASRQRATPAEHSGPVEEALPRSSPRARYVRSRAKEEAQAAASLATVSAPAAPALASLPELATAPAPEDCMALARTGQAAAAERCFSERASGSGLSAEMALYEVARLRRDVLHDAEGALSALREHGQRFPRGSLRNEVELSRVELLAKLGRTGEALLESEALLGSEAGRERAAELHVLRGNVYHRDLADPRAAAAEYAQAQARGGSLGAEAARLRGNCLEALGDVDGALQAYRQYTSVPGQPHAGEVLRQIERLSALAQQRGVAP